MPQESEFAISIENVGKKYTIGHQRASGDGMRHVIEGAMRAPIAWLRRRQEQKIQQVDFWALKDVSIQINQGEVVGLLGRNGAGKSTLLKLLSRITVPTEGRIRIRGRVASLLEVGTGFHPELTGRENIFLNGAILGMRRTEIIRKFDEIVAFSEIEEFIDTPVKRYSSGMYVRLAFAVAAHLDPEILIVDEVLAVGDTSFQKKCLAKMVEFARAGKTILFVSHNLDAVRGLCQRGIWMKDGHVYKDGGADDIIEEYFNTVTVKDSKSLSNPDYEFAIERVVLRNGFGEECNHILPGEDLTVEIRYDAQKRIDRPYVTIGIVGVGGSCLTANMLLDGRRPDELLGKGKLSCRFKGLPLLPQRYIVKISVRTNNGDEMIVNYQDAASFSVVGDLSDYGFRGEFMSRAATSTPVVIPYEWELPDGQVAAISLAESNRLVRKLNGESLVSSNL
jgi:homopolymeric O-antigen transport system ATP-binding protein